MRLFLHSSGYNVAVDYTLGVCGNWHGAHDVYSNTTKKQANIDESELNI